MDATIVSSDIWVFGTMQSVLFVSKKATQNNNKLFKR